MKYILLAKAVINKILDKAVGPLEMAILGIVVISTLSYALAWQAPGGNPPVGNTDAPINVSSNAQIKGGNLVVNALGITASGNALLVSNGNVGIGTISPGQKLSVAGIIESTSGGFKFPDGSIQTTSATASATAGFGPRSVMADNTVYQALTDGFVMAIYNANGSIYGYTDSNNPPTTMMARNGAPNSVSGSITFPVRKGDYWRVTSSSDVFWVPFGN